MHTGVRAAAVMLLVLGVSGCRRAEKPRTDLAAVEHCESGVLRAIEAPTRTEGSRIYHESCKDVYVEPACREAFAAAATGDPDRATLLVSAACQKAYCPILPNAAGLEACRPPFKSSLDNVLRTWPPLHQAIITHDAKGFSPRVMSALFRFYVRATKPWPRGGAEANPDSSVLDPTVPRSP